MKATPTTLRTNLAKSVRVRRGHSSLVDEAYNAFCKLRDEGAHVNPQQFCDRFPTVKSSLVRLIEAHRFLEDHSELIEEQTPVSWPVPGETIGGFLLLDELGQGAFARVFRAEQSAMGGRLVAVKISRSDGFEAATLGRIEHPNITPVYSVEEIPDTGLSAVCMPYRGSATLAHLVDFVYAAPGRDQNARVILEVAQDPHLPKPERPESVLRRGTFEEGVRWLGAQLADALAHIHAEGICHRDVKPSNVLLTPDGTPKLLDFNLSSNELVPDTRFGGTLLYMAPEQLLATAKERRGDARLVGPASDLFSLGVILYELLSGKNPFGPLPLDKSTEELRQYLLQRQFEGVRPLRSLRPQIDGSLARVVELCLSQDPSRRPSALELGRTLRRGLSWRARSLKWLTRHRKLTAAAVVLTLAAAAAGAVHVANLPPAHEVQYTQAMEAYRRGHFDQAALFLKQSLIAKPKQADAHFALGRVFQKMAANDKQYLRDAIHEFRQAEEYGIQGKSQAAHGYCLNWQQLPNAAVLYYEKACKNGMATAAVLNNLGLSLMEIADYKEAYEPLLKAVALDASLQAGHHNLVLWYMQRGFDVPADQRAEHWAKGIVHLERALAGKISGALAYDAAKLYALVARHDDKWKELALTWLAKSLDLGVDPEAAKLQKDAAFRAIKDDPRFGEMCDRIRVAHPDEHAIRFVDPIIE
ncbi:MAG: protein kinase [Gemmataceae bacterium]|nr:protein kinase [Gemmataceae bacterium]MCI0737526.1 protein kinase [Gemmataceae bacterium]